MILATLTPVSRRAVLGTIAAAILVAGGIGIGVASADNVPALAAPGPGQVRIATDKPAYAIGDPITITYTVPGPGRIVITDHQATGVSTLRSQRVGTPGKKELEVTGQIKGVITPPAGKECLKLQHTDDAGQTASAETCFQVKETEGPAPGKTPEQTPPGQGQPETPKAPDQAEAPAITAGLYSLQNRETGLRLNGDYLSGLFTNPDALGRYGTWEVEPAPDGHVFLRNRETGFYLDSNAAGKAYGHVGNSGPFQQWKALPTQDGRYYFLQNRATGLMLDSNQQGIVYTLAANGGGFQQWRIQVVQP